MSGKYDKCISDPPPIRIGKEGQLHIKELLEKDAQSIPDLTLNYHFVDKPYVSKSTSHTHDSQEFLVWYGVDPEYPGDFGAEIVLYLGEEQEKHVITKPSLVSISPGLRHCPMEITRVDKPIFQITIMLAER
jgi:hypothetical protein